MLAVSIVFLALAICSFICFSTFISKVNKEHVIGQEKFKISGSRKRNLLILSALTGVLLIVAAFFYAKFKGFILNFWTSIAFIFGPFLFGSSLCFGIGAFVLYYYKLDLDEKQKRFCKFTWPISFVALLLGLLIYSEGIAINESIYPLISGISFKEGWIYGNDNPDGFKIKFYGVFIVCGALLCYAITDHMIYQKYKKHGLIDTLFVVAFLFGILGARLWYCIVLEPEIYFHNPEVPPFYFITGIADGGLAIQGGALLGIISGVTFVLVFRKYIDLRYIMDIAIPTILLAQVIGRWGNFFNQEVYGMEISRQALWFLPTIIKENMLINGAYRVPLFFIEGLINLCGYFFIRYFLGKVCKFHLGLGYQASFYLVWYGMVRAILELLRDPQFRYMNSWYIAFGMMGLGFVLFGVMYFIHYMRLKAGKEDKFGNKIKEAK